MYFFDQLFHLPHESRTISTGLCIFLKALVGHPQDIEIVSNTHFL